MHRRRCRFHVGPVSWRENFSVVATTNHDYSMRRCPDNQRAQHNGCCAVGNMLLVKMKVTFCDALDAHKLIIAAVKKYFHDVIFQLHGIKFLANMAMFGD